MYGSQTDILRGEHACTTSSNTRFSVGITRELFEQKRGSSASVRAVDESSKSGRH